MQIVCKLNLQTKISCCKIQICNLQKYILHLHSQNCKIKHSKWIYHHVSRNFLIIPVCRAPSLQTHVVYLDHLFPSYFAAVIKKVSDEVITKIHESFPQLSILWLMFGEGNMVTSSNIEISEPENAGSPLLHANQHLDNEPNNPETGNPCNHRELSQSTNIPPLPGINVPDSVPDNTPFAISSSSAVKNNTSPSCNTASALNNVQHDSMPIIGINSNDAGQRRVVSIMVFYNDNSFETFVPEKTK